MTQYQPHTPPKLYNHGFTLVELMVVIAVMGIIAAMAAPSMQNQITQSQVKNSVNLLADTLKQAKADAIIYRTNVMVKIDPSSHKIILARAVNNPNPTTCTTSSTNSSTCKVVERRLNDNISIVSDSTDLPLTIHFTPGKRIYKNDSGTTGLPIGSGYLVCYRNVPITNNKVLVETVGTVQIISNGSCS